MENQQTKIRERSFYSPSNSAGDHRFHQPVEVCVCRSGKFSTWQGHLNVRWAFFGVFSNWYEYLFDYRRQPETICAMVHTIQNTYTPEERTVIFFRHIRRDLGIPSPRKLTKLVGSVLGHLQMGLSIEQSKELMNRLPGLFRVLLAKNKKQPSDQKSFSHLDELVENIYEDDRKSGHVLFSTEVQALNAVVIILRKLDKFLGLFSYNILKHQLVEGLKQIPLEEAA